MDDNRWDDTIIQLSGTVLWTLRFGWPGNDVTPELLYRVALRGGVADGFVSDGPRMEHPPWTYMFVSYELRNGQDRYRAYGSPQPGTHRYEFDKIEVHESTRPTAIYVHTPEPVDEPDALTKQRGKELQPA